MNKEIERLLNLVEVQIKRKAQLYDGFTTVSDVAGLNTISRFMFSVIEEAGEVSSALTRQRYQLAMDECIDVAHSALLLYLAIESQKNQRISEGEN